MLKYCAFKIGSLLFPLLPVRLGYFLASLAGEIGYWIAKGARRTVRGNMKRVLGTEVSEEKLRRTEKEIFKNAAKNYYDLSRIPHVDAHYWGQIVTVHGWHHFEKALASMKGVIIATAHLGNIDVVVQAMITRSIKVTVLAEPLRPPRLFELFARFRESKGLSFLPVSLATLKTLVDSLRRGGVIAVACDRDIQKKGMPINFLGAEATVPTGAVDLALRTGATIIPAFSIRRTNNHFDVYMEPPLELTIDGNRRKNIQENLAKIVTLIEKYVQRYPEQWVVFEPIWAGGS